MTPEEMTGIARAVAGPVTALQTRLEAIARELEDLRAAHGAPIAAALLDADGALRIVQRTGEAFIVPLPDAARLAADAAAALRAPIAEGVCADVLAHIERTLAALVQPPAWTPEAVYAAGDIVTAHIGRTYRVRAGVRAALGRDPGDDAEHWERLGSAGFRVFKSRPERLEPGDVFTEGDARFLHDGAQTILFVPKAAKVSDIERALKAPHNLAQAAHASARGLADQVATLTDTVARQARGDADALGTAAEALAQVESLRRDLAALGERLDALTRQGVA
jgi:hypothetical protein